MSDLFFAGLLQAILTGIATWVVTFFIKRLIHKLDSLAAAVVGIQIDKAKMDGKFDLIWKELGHLKEVGSENKKSLSAAWESISKIANPRVSDLLRKSIQEDVK